MPGAMQLIGLLQFIGGFVMLGIAAYTPRTDLRLLTAGFGVIVMIGGYLLLKNADRRN